MHNTTLEDQIEGNLVIGLAKSPCLKSCRLLSNRLGLEGHCMASFEIFEHFCEGREQSMCGEGMLKRPRLVESDVGIGHMGTPSCG